eukprot:TRINITY_DN26715_c0_g1_i1.p1 TRINITY_DN26715_c0_g1~~TRINITY_DN26715_c0_g1_i1.p1  ORF type:complete len:415 (+),score=120.54 TRINITY_DN26715_c0_g1_i1:163-1245(+)
MFYYSGPWMLKEYYSKGAMLTIEDWMKSKATSVMLVVPKLDEECLHAGRMLLQEIFKSPLFAELPLTVYSKSPQPPIPPPPLHPPLRGSFAAQPTWNRKQNPPFIVLSSSPSSLVVGANPPQQVVLPYSPTELYQFERPPTDGKAEQEVPPSNIDPAPHPKAGGLLALLGLTQIPGKKTNATGEPQNLPSVTLGVEGDKLSIVNDECIPQDLTPSMITFHVNSSNGSNTNTVTVGMAPMTALLSTPDSKKIQFLRTNLGLDPSPPDPYYPLATYLPNLPPEIHYKISLFFHRELPRGTGFKFECGCMSTALEWATIQTKLFEQARPKETQKAKEEPVQEEPAAEEEEEDDEEKTVEKMKE